MDKETREKIRAVVVAGQEAYYVGNRANSDPDKITDEIAQIVDMRDTSDHDHQVGTQSVARRCGR